MSSMRQISANQQNSLLSTGPKTEHGKYVSSRNSTRHGLSGSGLILPDEEHEAVAERFAQWHASFKPFHNFDVWLVETVAVESVRVDRCRWHEADVRERNARRAADFWDEDRKLAAAELAAELRKKPELISRKLRQTTQGADLLIGRWQELAATLRRDGRWADPQRAIALDLLGVSPERREGVTALDLPEGESCTEAEWQAQTVEYHLGELRALKPRLDGLDAAEQLAAMQGMPPTTDAEVRRIRRYESGCLRRLQTAVGRLRSRKGLSMSPQPAQAEGRPEVPSSPLAAERERERREEARHVAAQLGGWAALASSGVDHEFADPGALVAGALEAHPAAAVAAPDYGPPDDASGNTGEDDEPMVPVVIKPVSLASALRPATPAPRNRRARRAARSKARRGG